MQLQLSQNIVMDILSHLKKELAPFLLYSSSYRHLIFRRVTLLSLRASMSSSGLLRLGKKFGLQNHMCRVQIWTIFKHRAPVAK